MSNFDVAFAQLLGNEGSYTIDNGGPTMWGITQAVARNWGYVGDMKLLSQETAKAIALREYWQPFGCDSLPLALAFQVFDTAYNGGHPVQWLQIALGFASADVDGHAGPQTIAAAVAADVWKTVALFNAQRLRYLANLKQPQAADGRMNRIAGNLEKGNMT